MSELILFHGDKGGTGKSFSCMVFLDTIYKNNDKYVVIDADLRNPDILNTYGNSIEVEALALTTHEEWIYFFDKLEQYYSEGKKVIVSLPSQAGDIINRESELFKLFHKELKFKITLVWVMNRQNDSIRLLNACLKDIPKPSKTLIILNGFYGSANNFQRWNDLKFREDLLKEGAIEVYLPELHSRIVDQILNENPPLLPYSDAIKSTKIPLTSRIELQSWLKTASECFESIK